MAAASYQPKYGQTGNVKPLKRKPQTAVCRFSKMTKSHLGIQTVFPSAYSGYNTTLKARKEPEREPWERIFKPLDAFWREIILNWQPALFGGKSPTLFSKRRKLKQTFQTWPEGKNISTCITFGGFKEETPIQVRLSNTCICINRQLYCSGAQKRIPRIVTIKNLWTKSHVIAWCGSLSHKNLFHKTLAKTSFILQL